jgi:hypothetical protein
MSLFDKYCRYLPVFRLVFQVFLKTGFCGAHWYFFPIEKKKYLGADWIGKSPTAKPAKQPVKQCLHLIQDPLFVVTPGLPEVSA